MKKQIKLLVFTLVIMFAAISFSCEESSCDGKGTLSLENKSIDTVQRIMIDGVNYGSLDPGEKEEIELAAGQHVWQLVGISGGAGCSEAYVIIQECETTAFSCSN